MAGFLFVSTCRRADNEMPLKESEAIILRSFSLGEADRIVSFLDRQAGRLKGVAKAALRPKSRFGSTLEPLSYVRIWYYERENRDLVRITQCELIESFLEVQNDYEASVNLALVSEVTEAALDELEPAETQFRLDLLIAREIKKRGASKVVLAYFCLWTAKLGGWLSSFERCSKCDGPITEEAFELFGGAGLACSKCGHRGARRISKESLTLGKRILAAPLDQVISGCPNDSVAGDILSYALDVLERHIERRLSTRQTLNSIEKSKIESESKT